MSARLSLDRPSFRPVDVVSYCEQLQPRELLLHNQACRAELVTWTRQSAMLLLEKRLFWTLVGRRDKLSEVSASRFRGGWLFTVKFRDANGLPRRWHSFGTTPNVMLANALHKLGNWGFEPKDE